MEATAFFLFAIRYSLFAPSFLNLIPNQRRDIRAAKPLDRPDAGRRSDVDLGQIAVDHVDAHEQEATLAQRRPEPRADLALARRKVGRLRRAAPHHVGA